MTARPVGRPRATQRRGELIDAAGVLFARRGFGRVSVADVATSLGLSAPAVYRHISGKSELLAEAVSARMDEFLDAASGNLTLPNLTHRLASALEAHPESWLLLRRESRQLNEAGRKELELKVRTLVDRYALALASALPELDGDDLRFRASLGLACLSAPAQFPGLVASASRLSASSSATEVARLAIEMCTSEDLRTEDLGDFEPPEGGWWTPDVGTRGEILAAALGLMSRRGYSAVDLEGLGDAAGMSGPSLYHHFESKNEILATILEHAADLSEQIRKRDLRRSKTIVDVRTSLTRSYVAFAITEPDVFRLYLHDAIHLELPARARVAEANQRLVSTWAAFSEATTDAAVQGTARLRVACALATVNDTVAAAGHRVLTERGPEILGAVRQLLGAEVPM